MDKVRGYKIKKTQGTYLVYVIRGPLFRPWRRWDNRIGVAETWLGARQIILAHVAAERPETWVFDKDGLADNS